MNRRNILNDDQIKDLLDLMTADDKSTDDEEDDELFSEHNSDSEQSDICDNVDESERGFDSRGFSCSEKPSSSKVLSHNIIKFKSGPKIDANKTDILSIFKHYFTDSMIRLIRFYTNKNIFQTQQKYNTPQAFNCEVTEDELWALIGLFYLIGVCKSAHENVLDLWDTNGYGRDIFRAIMPYKRFLFLVQNLRFDDKDTRELRKEKDKLACIREIWDDFVKQCIRNYILSENVTIDEMLRAFRGRCGFKQYMPKKPAKYGLKIFMLCDSQTYYMYDAIVYVGKDSDKKAKNVGQNIVLKLCNSIRGSGRNITTDNWFTSFPLAEELHLSNLTIVGTLKANKPEVPKTFLANKNKEVNSSMFGFYNNITLVSFVPKKSKVVLLLSSMHHDEAIDEKTKKPEIIMYYNKTKGGVDTLDQLCVTYTTGRSTRRWPLCLFYCMLDIIGYNSYVLFSHFNNTNESKYRREYLKKLGTLLAMPHIIKRLDNKNLSRPLRAVIEKVSGHKTEDQSVTKKQKTSQYNNNTRCYICPRNANRVTSIKCKTCNRLICKEHKTIYCTPCAEECDYLENE